MADPIDVDICVTCISDKPPQLPLREELNSLGVEVVYRASGTGALAVKKEKNRVLEKFRRKEIEKKMGSCLPSFPQSPKKKRKKQMERERKEKELNSLRSISYEDYVGVLRETESGGYSLQGKDSQESLWEARSPVSARRSKVFARNGLGYGMQDAKSVPPSLSATSAETAEEDTRVDSPKVQKVDSSEYTGTAEEALAAANDAFGTMPVTQLAKDGSKRLEDDILEGLNQSEKADTSARGVVNAASHGESAKEQALSDAFSVFKAEPESMSSPSNFVVGTEQNEHLQTDEQTMQASVASQKGQKHPTSTPSSPNVPINGMAAAAATIGALTAAAPSNREPESETTNEEPAKADTPIEMDTVLSFTGPPIYNSPTDEAEASSVDSKNAAKVALGSLFDESSTDASSSVGSFSIIQNPMLPPTDSASETDNKDSTTEETDEKLKPSSFAAPPGQAPEPENAQTLHHDLLFKPNDTTKTANFDENNSGSFCNGLVTDVQKPENAISSNSGTPENANGPFNGHENLESWMSSALKTFTTSLFGYDDDDNEKGAEAEKSAGDQELEVIGPDQAPIRSRPDPVVRSTLFSALADVTTQPDDVQKLLELNPEMAASKLDSGGRLPLHVACDKTLPYRSLWDPSLEGSLLIKDLSTDMARHLELIDVVSSRHMDACMVPDASGDLPVHLLARRLIKWEEHWERELLRVELFSKTDSDAVTVLYKTMSQCIEIVLDPVASTRILCRARGSAGRILPLHIAAWFGVSASCLKRLLEEYPEAAAVPSDFNRIVSGNLNNSLSLELFECRRDLGQGLPMAEYDNQEDYDAQAESFRESVLKSDLIFAFNPSILPFRQDPSRIKRIEAMIQADAELVTAEKPLNPASRAAWIWMCTFDDGVDSEDTYVDSVRRIANSLDSAAVKELAMTETDDGTILLDAALPECAEILKERIGYGVSQKREPPVSLDAIETKMSPEENDIGAKLISGVGEVQCGDDQGHEGSPLSEKGPGDDEVQKDIGSESISGIEEAVFAAASDSSERGHESNSISEEEPEAEKVPCTSFITSGSADDNTSVPDKGESSERQATEGEQTLAAVPDSIERGHESSSILEEEPEEEKEPGTRFITLDSAVEIASAPDKGEDLESQAIEGTTTLAFALHSNQVNLDSADEIASAPDKGEVLESQATEGTKTLASALHSNQAKSQNEQNELAENGELPEGSPRSYAAAPSLALTSSGSLGDSEAAHNEGNSTEAESEAGESESIPQEEEESMESSLDGNGELSSKLTTGDPTSTEEFEPAASASFDTAEKIDVGVLCKVIFNVKEESFPSSFVIMPYKLKKEPGGTLTLESPEHAHVAMKFAQCLLRMTEAWNVYHVLEKKSIEHLGHKIVPEHMNAWRERDEKNASMELVLLSLYDSNKGYLYFLDECTGVPMVESSSDGQDAYPIEIDEAVHTVQRLLPLMLMGMVRMRGERALAVLAKTIMQGSEYDASQSWIQVSHDIVKSIQLKEKRSDESVSSTISELASLSEELIEYQTQVASSDKPTRIESKTGCEWIVEVSFMKTLLAAVDSRSAYAGLKPVKNKRRTVLWTIPKEVATSENNSNNVTSPNLEGQLNGAQRRSADMPDAIPQNDQTVQENQLDQNSVNSSSSNTDYSASDESDTSGSTLSSNDVISSVDTWESRRLDSDNELLSIGGKLPAVIEEVDEDDSASSRTESSTAAEDFHSGDLTSYGKAGAPAVDTDSVASSSSSDTTSSSSTIILDNENDLRESLFTAVQDEFPVGVGTSKSGESSSQTSQSLAKSTEKAQNQSLSTFLKSAASNLEARRLSSQENAVSGGMEEQTEQIDMSTRVVVGPGNDNSDWSTTDTEQDDKLNRSVINYSSPYMNDKDYVILSRSEDSSSCSMDYGSDSDRDPSYYLEPSSQGWVEENSSYASGSGIEVCPQTPMSINQVSAGAPSHQPEVNASDQRWILADSSFSDGSGGIEVHRIPTPKSIDKTTRDLSTPQLQAEAFDTASTEANEELAQANSEFASSSIPAITEAKTKEPVLGMLKSFLYGRQAADGADDSTVSDDKEPTYAEQYNQGLATSGSSNTNDLEGVSTGYSAATDTADDSESVSSAVASSSQRPPLVPPKAIPTTTAPTPRSAEADLDTDKEDNANLDSFIGENKESVPYFGASSNDALGEGELVQTDDRDVPNLEASSLESSEREASNVDVSVTVEKETRTTGLSNDTCPTGAPGRAALSEIPTITAPRSAEADLDTDKEDNANLDSFIGENKESVPYFGASSNDALGEGELVQTDDRDVPNLEASSLESSEREASDVDDSVTVEKETLTTGPSNDTCPTGAPGRAALSETSSTGSSEYTGDGQFDGSTTTGYSLEYAGQDTGSESGAPIQWNPIARNESGQQSSRTLESTSEEEKSTVSVNLNDFMAQARDVRSESSSTATLPSSSMYAGDGEQMSLESSRGMSLESSRGMSLESSRGWTTGDNTFSDVSKQQRVSAFSDTTETLGESTTTVPMSPNESSRVSLAFDDFTAESNTLDSYDTGAETVSKSRNLLLEEQPQQESPSTSATCSFEDGDSIFTQDSLGSIRSFVARLSTLEEKVLQRQIDLQMLKLDVHTFEIRATKQSFDEARDELARVKGSWEQAQRTEGDETRSDW